jgi:hypothetical protein
MYGFSEALSGILTLWAEPAARERALSASRPRYLESRSARGGQVQAVDLFEVLIAHG